MAEQPLEAYTIAVDALGLDPVIRWRVELRPKRTTIGLTVERDGTVTIATPPAAPPDRVAEFVNDKRGWLLRHALDKAKYAPSHPVKELVNGEGFEWLGMPHRLQLVDDLDNGEPVRRERAPSWHHASWYLCLRRDHAQDAGALIRWYRAAGLVWITRYVARHEWRAGVAGLRHEVCDLGWKWATYKPRTAHGRTVRWHWALFQLPVEFIGLEVAHELVHASEPPGRPHGPEWQSRMELWLPDWRDRAIRLKEAGRSVWLGDIQSRPHK